MTRTLVLMRHGKSGYPDGVADRDRPLADRGRREAALAGEWMRRDGLAADAVVCSTAVRTRQTLERTGIEAPSVTFVEDVYGGWPEDVLEAIRVHVPADASTVLVVGHEPGMPMTARTLDPAAEVDHFVTSAYAVLSVSAPWDRLGCSADDTATFRGLFVPR
ncbi:SixA phosphatase family protein [Williamsia sp. SKLECPSW1]